MNVERWVAKRRPVWQELELLLQQIEKSGISSLNREQLQSLGRLYRYISADLSRARALNLGSDILGYLNSVVVKAHNQVYQQQKNRAIDLFNFFYSTFPGLVRQNIGYVAVAFCICFAGGFVCYDFAQKDVNFGHMEMVENRPLVSDQIWDIIEEHKIWTDTLQDQSPVYASSISTNNIRVCLLSFILGVTGGLGTVFVLFFNGMSFGTVLGVCKHYGLLSNIALFAVAHGSLELPSIFISGGAGLVMGRGILFPGDLSRMDALRKYTKQALGMFAGCVPLLLIAGAVEAFVSPRTDLDPHLKVVAGAGLFLCLLVYLFVPRLPFEVQHTRHITS